MKHGWCGWPRGRGRRLLPSGGGRGRPREGERLTGGCSGPSKGLPRPRLAGYPAHKAFTIAASSGGVRVGALVQKPGMSACGYGRHA